MPPHVFHSNPIPFIISLTRCSLYITGCQAGARALRLSVIYKSSVLRLKVLGNFAHKKRHSKDKYDAGKSSSGFFFFKLSPTKTATELMSTRILWNSYSQFVAFLRGYTETLLLEISKKRITQEFLERCSVKLVSNDARKITCTRIMWLNLNWPIRSL